MLDSSKISFSDSCSDLAESVDGSSFYLSSNDEDDVPFTRSISSAGHATSSTLADTNLAEFSDYFSDDDFEFAPDEEAFLAPDRYKHPFHSVTTSMGAHMSRTSQARNKGDENDLHSCTLDLASESGDDEADDTFGDCLVIDGDNVRIPEGETQGLHMTGSFVSGGHTETAKSLLQADSWAYTRSRDGLRHASRVIPAKWGPAVSVRNTEFGRDSGAASASIQASNELNVLEMETESESELAYDQ